MIWMLHLFFDNLFFWSILNENVIVNSEAENVNTKIEAETFELLWMFFSLPFTEALYGILTWSCEHFWLTHNWIFQWFYYLEKKKSPALCNPTSTGWILDIFLEVLKFLSPKVSGAIGIILFVFYRNSIVFSFSYPSSASLWTVFI